MSEKILFITCDRVKDSYGITSGLYNSAKFVRDFLISKGKESKLISVVDSNQIDREVTSYNPDVIIIEAMWVPPAKFQELLQIPRHQNRRWIVRIHSKAPFLSNEGMAIRWIADYTRVNGVIEIAPNTKELCLQLKAAFPEGHFVYLPNVYFFDNFERGMKDENDTIIHVGCFGAVRPMKNTFQQALAALEFTEREGKKLHFHINATRIEQSGDNVLKNLRALFQNSYHELIEHYWYNHSEFLKVATTMDIGTQVSFSESFNIVTADFVTAEVPIVASDDIEWMPSFLKCSPTDHEKMVKRMRRAYHWKKLSTWLQMRSLKLYNYKAKLTWLVTI